MSEDILYGGVANAGKVTRAGQYLYRPQNAHSASIHRFLADLHASGFDGASRPVGITPDGREQLVYMEGDVPLPPYPAWAQGDAVLASVARLMRRFHDASARVSSEGLMFSAEMADPAGGPTICHNDVCLENVVFRDGVAVGLLDFDFAAPGRPLYDLAQFARMCVPVDDDVSADRMGWMPADRPHRLRTVAEAYGLTAGERQELISILAETIARGGEFVLRRVEEGDPNFIRMWDEMGGSERFDRRRRWWTAERGRYLSALS